MVEFYELRLTKCRPGEAVERNVGDVYIQHGPGGADGKEGFITRRALRLRVSRHLHDPVLETHSHEVIIMAAVSVRTSWIMWRRTVGTTEELVKLQGDFVWHGTSALPTPPRFPPERTPGSPSRGTPDRDGPAGFQVKYGAGASFHDQLSSTEQTFYFLTEMPWPNYIGTKHKSHGSSGVLGARGDESRC